MAGWSSEKDLGRPVQDVFSVVDGISRKRAKNPAQRAVKEGQIVELALGSVLMRSDGTDIAIEDSVAPIYDRTGRVAGAVIVFHDARTSVILTLLVRSLTQVVFGFKHIIAEGLIRRIPIERFRTLDGRNIYRQQ